MAQGSSNKLCTLKGLSTQAFNLCRTYRSCSLFDLDEDRQLQCEQCDTKNIVIMSENYLMLSEPHGLYSFPSTRPTTPSQGSGPSYGPAQVLLDDNPEFHGPRVRRPSRGGSQVGTPNADFRDMAIQPTHTQGFPVDSVCALSSPGP